MKKIFINISLLLEKIIKKSRPGLFSKTSVLKICKLYRKAPVPESLF